MRCLRAVVVLLWSAPLLAQHWAYRPLPQTQDVEIDRRIETRLAAVGLTRSERATKAELVRRLYLTLHGLPPTPEAFEAAVTNREEDGFERLVDRLLDSPRYGERQAQHWLDVVRFAETHGFETNSPRSGAFRYRDWVIRAFHDDLRYDEFILRQLAGDAVGDDAATGFLVAGPWDQVKSPDRRLTAEQRSNELADIVGVTGTAFLGTTVGCARCHDHKFDPVSQWDYYAMEAVFAGVRHGSRAVRPQNDADRLDRLATCDARLAAIDEELSRHEPLAGGPIVVIDDEDAERVERLVPARGHGKNPAGSDRGAKDDLGDAERLPNLSAGRYTWWTNRPGVDVLAYRPGVHGAFRVWVSWGCGFETHSTDAIWLRDADGDLATVDDQLELARVDQQAFADGGRGEVLPAQPLWSGLRDLGVVTMAANSRIVLRCGGTGEAITADVVVLQPAARGTRLHLRAPVHALGTTERFAPRLADALRITVEATSNGIEPCIDELRVWTAGDRANVALAANGGRATASSEYPNSSIHKIAHANDGLVGNSHSWISAERGAGWLQVDFAAPAVVDSVSWARDATGRFQDRVPMRYRIDVRVPGTDSWRQVASTDDRVPFGASPSSQRIRFLRGHPDDVELADLWTERDGLAEERSRLATLPTGYLGRFEQPGPTHRMHRGDPLAPRETVAPGAIESFGELVLSKDMPEQERRLALARWITRDAAALAARVMVNRIWQQHFGVGLVATPSDFGKNGAEPTHPELLDELAAAFIANDWSVKWLHRTIVSSATWRQSSAAREDGLARDAAARLLWRFPPRRLDAEAIRDGLLQAAGRLNLAVVGGAGFSVFEPNSNYVRVYRARREFEDDAFRRAIYATRVRMERDPTFGVFDCPDGGQPAPTRARSTTALQALSLLNSPFVLQCVDLISARIEGEESGVDRRVRRAFELILLRQPAADELERARELALAHGLKALCRALYNLNEFVFLS